jgi:hypothetical protein
MTPAINVIIPKTITATRSVKKKKIHVMLIEKFSFYFEFSEFQDKLKRRKKLNRFDRLWSAEFFNS